MKIVTNFLKILLLILLMLILIQNSHQIVSIQILNKSFENINLAIILIICLAIGAMIGAVFLAFAALQSHSEIRTLKRANQKMLKELERLRNISVEDIPEADLPDPSPDAKEAE